MILCHCPPAKPEPSEMSFADFVLDDGEELELPSECFEKAVGISGREIGE